MTLIETLIEKLEKADAPCRKLDAEIREHVVGLRMYESIHERGGDLCLRYYPGPPGPDYLSLPRYTKMVDAAMTLVPEPYEGILDICQPPVGRYYAKLWPMSNSDADVRGDGINPAIALVIAAIKARSHGEDERS